MRGSCGSARREVLLALGANVAGLWGSPAESLARALDELEAVGIVVLGRSSLYQSQPVGHVRQPLFVNAVVAVASPLPPARLLRLLKTLERAAGRRQGVRWGPRPLDLDMLDFAGRRCNAATKATRPGPLILPHPEMHRRAFVLAPLAEVAPGWRHPVLGRTAAALLHRHASAARRLARLPGWPETTGRR